MDYSQLFAIADRARAGSKPTGAEVAFVSETVPDALATYPDITLPRTVRHPAGFSVSGAPVGTFLRSALLHAGAKVFGKRYEGSDFYFGVERDLAFGIMRSHFHHGHPKGAHCCSQCTLAVLPVLEAGLIRYFDCAPLAENVRRVVTKGDWRFATAPNAKMAAWSLGA
jgi:hypothetical protein